MNETLKSKCPWCKTEVTLDVVELGSAIEGDQVTLRRLATGTHTCSPAKVSITEKPLTTTGAAKPAEIKDAR